MVMDASGVKEPFVGRIQMVLYLVPVHLITYEDPNDTPAIGEVKEVVWSRSAIADMIARCALCLSC